MPITAPGIFDTEIQAELLWTCATRDEFETQDMLKKAPSDWRTTILSTMAMSRRNSGMQVPLLLVIRYTVRAILDYKLAHSPAMEWFYSKTTCSVVFDHKWETCTAAYAFRPSCRWNEFSALDVFRACACVAVWTDDRVMLAHFVNRAPNPRALNHASLFVPSLQWAAARTGDARLLQDLHSVGVLFRHADPARVRYNHQSPMIAACRGNRPEHRWAVLVILASLFERGRCENAHRLQAEFLRAIEYARATPAGRELWGLLAHPDVVAAYSPHLGRALFPLCTRRRDPDLVRYLLERGVDPHWPDRVDERHLCEMPLQACVEARDVELVRILLGADKSHPARTEMIARECQRVPLSTAVRNNDVACIEALLGGGAQVRGYTEPIAGQPTYFNALHEAVQQQHIEAFRAILSHLDVRTIEADRLSACESLPTTIRVGNIEMLRLLVDAGCNIHGTWSPPLPVRPFTDAGDADDNEDEYEEEQEPRPTRSQKQRQQKTELRKTKMRIPRSYRNLERPLIYHARRAGNEEAVVFLLSRGAVWEYPYDYILQKPGESADEVEERVIKVGAAALVRDRKAEREERAAEEKRATRDKLEAKRAKERTRTRAKRRKRWGEMEWDPGNSEDGGDADNNDGMDG